MSMFEEIENIPTPNEIPSAVSVSGENKFSETMDEVLAQNTDLHHRLSLTLRRNANLETRVTQTEEENKYLKQKTRSMDDELDILRSECGDNTVQLKDLNNQLSESEIKYARLYEVYSLQEKNLTETTRKLSLLNRFKQRVSFFVRLYINNLKKEVSLKEEIKQKHLEEIHYFKTAVGELRKKVIHLENQLASAKRKENALRDQFAQDLEEAVETIDKLKLSQS